MRRSIEAEQVGYVTREAGKPLRVDMMGGEFCGNASRSAAAWALACDGGTQGVYDVSCSGCDTVLPAKVAQKGDGLYEAFIEMPYPEDVSGVLVDAGEIPRTVFEECLDTPPEQLGARLNQGAHGADLVQAINEFAQTGDLGIIARRMQEGKMQIIRLAKWETDSLGPIVGYLYAREVEAEALRLIFGALAGGFEAELPEIYT